MFEYKMRSKQTLWNRAWPGTGSDFFAKHTAATHWYPSENMGIYMVSEKFRHSNAKTQKTGHSYTFFIKKRGFILAALKKGGGVFGRISVLCLT